MSKRTPLIVPYSKFRKACPKDYKAAKLIYPDGIPLTMAAARKLMAAGVDVMWGLFTLMTSRDRHGFVLFTLRQRQPHIVKLLKRAGLDEHAEAVATLKINTRAEAKAALPIWDAAWAAARTAARDAARTAAWDAAWAAAWDAAEDAAEDAADAAADAASEDAAWAAWDAAWDASDAASEAAARDAAWAAARDEQARWCLRRIRNNPTRFEPECEL